jgi:hypothetical protein
MAGFKRPTSKVTAQADSGTSKGKVYPTYDLQTKDEEGKLVRLCGLFQKVDKKGRPMWVGNTDDTVFFMFDGKGGKSLHFAEQVAKGEKRPPMQKLVEKLYENEAKSGVKYMRGKDDEGTEFLVFKFTPKPKKDEE